jgi:hypothetical protein
MLYRRVAILALLTMVLLGLEGGQTLAAKPSGGGHTTPSGSFSLVLLDSTDGSAHWGQRVTFDVTTDVSEPHVNVECVQGGAVVYGATTGFYAGYLWPWTQVMTLSSQNWTGGDADCTATLWYANGRKMPTLATIRFHAAP